MLFSFSLGGGGWHLGDPVVAGLAELGHDEVGQHRRRLQVALLPAAARRRGARSTGHVGWEEEGGKWGHGVRGCL